MIELTRNAEARAQIQVPDPQSVDAVDRGDGVGVLGALPGFDQGEEHGASIRFGKLLGDRTARVAVMGDPERHSARTHGRILSALDDAFRFLAGTDHRQYQPFGTGVERARDILVGTPRRAHQRRYRSCLQKLQRAFQRIDPETAVLGIEKHELTATRGQQVPNPGHRELPYQGAAFEALVLNHIA